jgi:hypothetical protein
MLREYGLKPHLVSKTQYSKAPEFEKKLKEAAGLYMNSPSNAVIRENADTGVGEDTTGITHNPQRTRTADGRL